MGVVTKALNFRLSQQLARGTAKKLGLGGIAGIVGLVAGIRAFRRTR
jgi:hypothetical protein